MVAMTYKLNKAKDENTLGEIDRGKGYPMACKLSNVMLQCCLPSGPQSR